EAARIAAAYQPPEDASVDVVPREGTGCACTEAPRGILYHRYAFDSAGRVLLAKIVPPTSQNQKSIEDDLRDVAPRLLDMPRDRATWLAEQTVRNYDPCISCS